MCVQADNMDFRAEAKATKTRWIRRFRRPKGQSPGGGEAAKTNGLPLRLNPRRSPSQHRGQAPHVKFLL